MARYTMTIKDIMETYDIFGFEYDAPDGVSKVALEGEFYAEYIMREIAYETFDIWFIKFKSKWLKMINKYAIMFAKEVNPFTTSKTTVNNTTNTNNTSTNKNKMTTSGSSESENKQMSVPVDSVISSTDVPSDMTKNSGSSEGETEQETENEHSGQSSYEGETSKQRGSNIEIINKYAKLKVVIDLFLDEFKDLFFGRY